jgi:hypothetical protein
MGAFRQTWPPGQRPKLKKNAGYSTSTMWNEFFPMSMPMMAVGFVLSIKYRLSTRFRCHRVDRPPLIVTAKSN